MVDAFLYPALVTADLHIHGRGNKGRLAEADALCSKIADIYRQQAAVGAPLRSLVLAGDILDRGGALPVPMILRLAETFRMFEQVWVIVGNHDTPMRSTAITQLDIFSLCGARIVKEPMVVGSALMLPYYSEVPKDIPDTVAQAKAKAETLSVTVNGAAKDVATAFDAQGNTYYRLRDLAFALKGTGAQFNVTWDGSVAVATGSAYESEALAMPGSAPTGEEPEVGRGLGAGRRRRDRRRSHGRGRPSRRARRHQLDRHRAGLTPSTG